MPGERVNLAGDTGGRIRSFVTALGRFPSDPLWVVVGGFAVNVRISEVHRLTNDLDTVTSSQAELPEIPLEQPGANRLDHAKLRFTGGMPEVDIDVMDDAAGHPLPAEPSDRAFALARRYAHGVCDRTSCAARRVAFQFGWAASIIDDALGSGAVVVPSECPRSGWPAGVRGR